MAEIIPFKGLRYSKEKVKIADVVTQPYDKINSAMQESYYKKSPYNIVNLILNREEDPYANAKEHFSKWISEKVLDYTDNEPCIYPYFQKYTTSTSGLRIRKGFIALLKLESFEKKIVLPHERTLSGPKEDRLKLIRATEANLELIFLLYSDPIHSIINLIDDNISRIPSILDVTEAYERGVEHRLWKISNPKIIKKIQDLMVPKTLLIADGHHRYETSLNYMKENPQARYIMAAFVAMEAPGLLILPTHRAIYGTDVKDFKEKISKFFDVKECKDKNALMEELGKAKAHTFGLYDKKYYLLGLKNTKMIDEFVEKGRTEEYRNLDVTVLHSLIIENVLSISKEAVARKENIEYLRYLDEGIKGVDSGKYSLFFILNPTKMEEVRNIAEKLETMPQKSTDFYPKLISGLVMNKL